MASGKEQQGQGQGQGQGQDLADATSVVANLFEDLASSESAKAANEHFAVFVGIRHDLTGREKLGVNYGLAGLFPDKIYLDKTGEPIYPYDAEDKELTEAQIFALYEGATANEVQLKLGTVIPLPIDDPAKMKIIERSGKFAHYKARASILEAYEAGKTPLEVYLELRGKNLIIGQAVDEKKPKAG